MPPTNKTQTFQIAFPSYLEFTPGRQIALQQLKKWKEIWPVNKYKSKTLASLYSAVIPGAGYVYTNEWGNAISSFTIISMFTGLTALALNQGETGLSLFSASLGLLFYGSNIYGSYYSAERFNQNLNKSYQKKLKLFSLNYKLMRF